MKLLQHTNRSKKVCHVETKIGKRIHQEGTCLHGERKTDVRKTSWIYSCKTEELDKRIIGLNSLSSQFLYTARNIFLNVKVSTSYN